MKKWLFVLIGGSILAACAPASGDAGGVAGADSLAVATSVVDTPPPVPEVDPAYQADQSVTPPSDTIVPNTGYSRRQLDSIGKAKMEPAKHEPGKSRSMPHAPAPQK